MKNKILKILSLIAICTLMIASLCSFTTVAPPDEDDNNYFPTADNVYMPSMNIHVGYKYSRHTTTIHQNYYGYFYNPNCTVVYGDDVSLIKNFASDYLVASTMSFDYHSQSATNHPSQYSLSGDVLAASVVIESDNPTTANFTGEVSFSGLQKISEIDEWCEVVFYDTLSGVLEYIDLNSQYYSLTVSVVNIEGGSYNTKTYVTNDYIGDVMGSFNGINLKKVVNKVLDDNNVEADYIDYVSICPTQEEGDGLRSFDMVKIVDVLRPVTLYSERRYDSFLGEYAIQINNLENEYKIFKIGAEKNIQDLTASLEEALERIKELEEGIENNKAIPLLFDGLYKVLYNTLTIFFNMDVFGTKLGAIVGLLLGAAVVIIILKVVL